MSKKQASEKDWVRESRFGRWFLTTNIWFRYVLTEAVLDFKRLLKDDISEPRQLLDAGCGRGVAFALLEQHFLPGEIIGVDIDKEQIRIASEAARRCKCKVKLEHSTVSNLNISDSSIDMVFCHQLIHHIPDQAKALEEFYRILVPGGVILISDSCRPFINSLLVRLFFQHPMNVQKTADEYVELVRSIGFKISERDIKASIPWWSRKDFGLAEKIGLKQPGKEVTEILMIARKP